MTTNRAFDIKNILKEIIAEAFSEKSKKEIEIYNKFFLELNDKGLRTCVGKYNPSTKNITIMALNRPIKYIIAVSLHELSHHIYFTNSKKLDHKESFYNVYESLVKASLKLGILTLLDIQMACDGADLQYVMPLLEEYKKKEKETYIIKIENAYNQKEMLIKKGFKWDKFGKYWELETSDLKNVINNASE